MSFIVMKTKTLRHKSYSHYLCALAVFDTLTLIIRLLESVDEYYVSNLKVKGVFQEFNNSACKLYNFITHVIALMCSWLVVFMALERVFAVCFPFKKTAFRQQTGAAVAICLLFVIVCVSQSFRFIMIEHITYDDQKNILDCLAVDDYLDIYTSLHVYFFQWTLVFVLPVIIIAVSNSIVLHHIFKVRKELSKEENYLTYRHGRALERRHRSTCMLLIVTFAYIITLLPLFALSLIVDVTIKVGDIETARNTYIALIPFLDSAVSISMLNYAINFFIYVVSGKRFRFELRSLFAKKRQVTRSFTLRNTREEYIRR